MMIHLLDPVTANGIAAGEVVERPASVVKELIENSLDAGAKHIQCQILQGGIKKIVIIDDGIGMLKEDARLAFERHATSKLHSLQDLDNLTTMGFRGEALASISAVSKVKLITRQIGQEKGYQISIEGGKIIEEKEVGCPEGTRIEVSDLFFNVPARYKFLKKDATEQGYISDLISRLALSRSDVSFRLSNKDKDLIHTPGDNNLLSSIYVLFGREVAEAMLSVESTLDQVQVNGYVSSPKIARGNRSKQVVFVNGRNIVSKSITAAIQEAGKTWFMKGKFPALVLNLSIPLHLVDVNVHPQKTEVRFWDEQIIFRAVFHALRDAWENHSAAIHGEIESKKFSNIKPISLDNLSSNSIKSNRDISENSLESYENNSNFTENLANKSPEQMEIYSPFVSSHHDKMNEEDNTLDQNIRYERVIPEQQSKLFMKEDKESIKEAKIRQNSDKKPNALHYLLEARLIGQVFKTYILLEHDDKFILIDQHAAHERILYEQLHEQHLKSKHQSFSKQQLLEPVSIDLDFKEISLLEEHQAEVNRLGFSFDIFGEKTVVLRTVPDTQKGILDPKKAFVAIVDALLDNRLFNEDKQEELLYTVACKAAIKANDNISYVEMKKLISDLTTLVNPFHCPHGRPLIIELSKTDLEKLFRRIV